MDAERQLELIKKNTVEIIREEELLERIKSKGSLKIKYGVDPTSPDIHLGHSVVLRKLKCFQDLGHKVILVIGDFTARVGDPSGRTSTRKPLSSEEIKVNARTYEEQVFKILDPERTQVVFNSRWLSSLRLSDVLKLASQCTVARILERDDFTKRYQNESPIGLHEFLYPLMQAYDSVALKADVEIGGTDQKFNLLMGRQIQKSYAQPPQVIITMPILEGTDGRQKMSKSLGNYIGVTEPPDQMYGKVMSIPDELIFKYFRLLTPLSEEEIALREKALKEGKLHPKEAKKELARQIVTLYWGKDSAEEEEKRFEAVFSRREIPEELPCFFLDSAKIKEGRVWIVRLLQLTGMVQSRSEARRLILQGGVRWDGKKIKDVNLEVHLDDEHILQVGKRKFLKIIKRTKNGQ
ncbi:tyrosine--tRNA ligase [Candidatus Aerophobetes bacterium]|uniref:Tyrosine--tRNA ligase n=1 Tax=Aerophobetes bacterium TaxID=2030807 RepID=A0A497E1P5_UNCAE|nr:MAG: tyrosine--tRNA ligase [Candidatus Aerophobetes bacterium]